MEKKNKREIGTVYENKAVLFLQEKDYEILERNFRCRYGEIDIIARDGAYLVFVEVKYRKQAYQGAALEAVTWQKQKRILQTARYYLYKTAGKAAECPCRFDVVAFEGERITHIRDAFGD
jgi:putative endonuclease